MYLLDSNIFFHFLNGNKKIIQTLTELDEKKFFISLITRAEVLLAAKKENLFDKEIEYYLKDLINLVIDSDIINEAIKFKRKYQLKIRFEDLIIAATAKNHHKTLITCDKIFLNFKDEINILLIEDI